MLAGGSESMSRAPFVLPRPDEALPHRIETVDTRLGWRLVNPAMKELHGLLSMGETAEEVAARYGVSRERQDAFALRSHQRAADARKNGHFDRELLPVERPDGMIVDTDECVREDTSLEKLSRLKPVFRAGGTVTAGNASPMNDGAAGLLLVGEEALNDLGLESLGRYVAWPPRRESTRTSWASAPFPPRTRRWRGSAGASATSTRPSSTRRSRPRPSPAWTDSASTRSG